MDGITILRRCRRYFEEVEGLNERIERRRALASRMTASYGSTGGGHGGAETDRMSAFVADLEMMEAQLKHREARYDAERMAAVELLDMCDTREANAMELYYIECRTMDGVAAVMGFTVQHARRLRKAAEAAINAAGDVSHLLPEWYMDEERER